LWGTSCSKHSAVPMATIATGATSTPGRMESHDSCSGALSNGRDAIANTPTANRGGRSTRVFRPDSRPREPFRTSGFNAKAQSLHFLLHAGRCKLTDHGRDVDAGAERRFRGPHEYRLGRRQTARDPGALGRLRVALYCWRCQQLHMPCCKPYE
jgi:hypothetical protein